MNLVRDVLDKRLLDKDNCTMGRADGIVLEMPQGRQPRLVRLGAGDAAASDFLFKQAMAAEEPDSYLLGAYSDFLLDRGRLVCAAHGASFELGEGRCVAGPCLGDRLRSVRLEADGDDGFRPVDPFPVA